MPPRRRRRPSRPPSRVPARRRDSGTGSPAACRDVSVIRPSGRRAAAAEHPGAEGERQHEHLVVVRAAQQVDPAGREPGAFRLTARTGGRTRRPRPRSRPLLPAAHGSRGMLPGGGVRVRGPQLRRSLQRVHRVEEDARAQLRGGEVPSSPRRPQGGCQVQVEMRGGPVIPAGWPLMYPQHVGSATPEEPLQAGQAVHEDHAPGPRAAAGPPRAGRRRDRAGRSASRTATRAPTARCACHPEPPVTISPSPGSRAEVAVARRQLGPGDGRDLTEGHDLAVRVVDRGADHPPAVLEARTRSRRRRATRARPCARTTARSTRADRRPPRAGNDAVVVRAVQDHLVTPAGQGGPAVGNVQDVVRPGRLEPARAERA